MLKLVDDLQLLLLDELDLSSAESPLNYNLAPLGMRTDIAMLGILFKVASGKGLTTDPQFIFSPPFNS